ncbi:hypothetical protein WR25_18706 [Diploscapter pachys]|uniref:Uncharacterized protein n=1 Tax=Diploscapter pachys TaxID=2018661 RepID=A0A2A2KFQ7_9BILA|nr:hypothetical protein WR25_18706 [Diploscapter pachys]
MSNITIIDYDPSAFFYLLLSISLPELLLNLVCTYCILYQSSGLNSSYRLCLLQLQISMAVYDLTCLAGGPLMFFPYPAGVAVSPLAVHFQLSSLALLCTGVGALTRVGKTIQFAIQEQCTGH